MQYQTCTLCHIILMLSSLIPKGTYGITIYQTPSVASNEGGSVIMNCTLSEESLGPVQWYKGIKQETLFYSQMQNETSGARVKLAGEERKRNIDLSITITTVTLEDADIYYCIKFKSDKQSRAAVGSGTQLYVNRKPSSPSVSGPAEKVILNSRVTVKCTSRGFSPPEINITWFQKETMLTKSSPNVTSNDGNRTYNAESNITLLAHINSPVTCRISHAALEQPLNAVFNFNDILKAIPSTPVISYTKKENAVMLNCTSLRFYPKNIRIQWAKDGKQIKELPENNISETTGGTFKITSIIKFAVTKANISSSITCQIVHLTGNSTSEQLHLKDVISVSPSLPVITGPSTRMTYMKIINLTCSSSGFYPQNITLKWFINDLQKNEKVFHVIKEHEDGTYNVTSTIEIQSDKQYINSVLTCQIIHLSQTLTSSTYNLSDVITVSPTMISEPCNMTLNATVSLACKATQFYPPFIRIIWLENETELFNGSSQGLFLSKDGTYTTVRYLSIKYTEEKVYSVFRCQAEHESILFNSTTCDLLKFKDKKDPVKRLSRIDLPKMAKHITMVSSDFFLKEHYAFFCHKNVFWEYNPGHFL
ncbi:signal-regulatory protein gamma-like [Protopterus annectens]|uniref:signal-regulatory protein gamma-like n=1 Tax=Protopterus annectens TaxID=7888 RepID=UPI001CFB24E4|nr:signal-regulatory protein gamma-like [Protopterus annectens]